MVFSLEASLAGYASFAARLGCFVSGHLSNNMKLYSFSVLDQSPDLCKEPVRSKAQKQAQCKANSPSQHIAENVIQFTYAAPCYELKNFYSSWDLQNIQNGWPFRADSWNNHPKRDKKKNIISDFPGKIFIFQKISVRPERRQNSTSLPPGPAEDRNVKNSCQIKNQKSSVPFFPQKSREQNKHSHNQDQKPGMKAQEPDKSTDSEKRKNILNSFYQYWQLFLSHLLRFYCYIPWSKGI